MIWLIVWNWNYLSWTLVRYEIENRVETANPPDYLVILHSELIDVVKSQMH